MKAPIPAAPVHPECDSGQALKSSCLEVFAIGHPPDDACEGDELLLLAAQKRISLEEWDDFPEKIRPLADDQHHGVIARPAAVVLPD